MLHHNCKLTDSIKQSLLFSFFLVCSLLLLSELIKCLSVCQIFLSIKLIHEHQFGRNILLNAKLLTTIKNHVIKYCEKIYERSGKNLFSTIKKFT